MLSPSSLTRESITCVSSAWQNGQCMAYAGRREAGGVRRNIAIRSRFLASLLTPYPSLFVNRKLRAQGLGIRRHAGDHLVVGRRFKHVGNQVRKLFGLR